jgi:23S rRNA (cytidine2498-2'-O)-methyltransferase
MSRHAFLRAEDSEAALLAELAGAFPGSQPRVIRGAVLEAEFEPLPGKPLPHLAFARQMLPYATWRHGESIRAWAGLVFESISGVLPDDAPWRLHIDPHYGAPAAHRIGARAWHTASRSGEASRVVARRAAPLETDAGRHRCRLIREAVIELLRKKRRHLLKQLGAEPVPWGRGESLVQLLLTSPEAGLISVAATPMPFEQRHLISPFPRGEIPVASDKSAPSRAFAKLVEAELRFGRGIRAGETCVDLGASPGSWTYVAAQRGARVVAVDRADLREDLMRDQRVRFVAGDAFRYQPEEPVDWLLCDVIAAPERTAALLLDWLGKGWCRHFIVTLKFGDTAETQLLDSLKRQLSSLVRELYVLRLCANKKEICVFGTAETRA